MKWFASGNEKDKKAVSLLQKLYDLSDNIVLKQFFKKYIDEIHLGTSVPYVLNAMNIEFISLVLKNKIQLTKKQEDIMTELRKLSYIKYGNL